jgi:hypothetical protein
MTIIFKQGDPLESSIVGILITKEAMKLDCLFRVKYLSFQKSTI